MGVVDISAINYLKNKVVFSDIINYMVYDGKEVVKPEQLQPTDTTQVFAGSEKFNVALKKQRDLFYFVNAMEDDHHTYLIIGLESQTKQDYSMPVRNMLYDALSYKDQIKALSEMYKKEKGFKNAEELLSGMKKNDRLHPVITLTVYFGPDEWDGPRSLHELLELEDETVKNFVQDYHVNLLEPAKMDEDDFQKLRSDLPQVMKFIKYSNNQEQLEKEIRADKRFSKVSNDAINFINVLTKSDFSISKEEEETNMCVALDGIKADARKDERIKTQQEERKKMREEKRKEYTALLNNSQLPPEECARLLDVPVKYFLSIINGAEDD